MNIRKIILICLISVLMLFPVSASASQEDMAVLEYDGGQKIYVVLPDDYDPDRQYPCVYFMPRDGYSAGEYLDGGTVDRVLELQSGHQIDEMICAFPEYRKGTDIYEQTSGIIEAVEKEYPAVSDAQHRAVLGTGAGGYMAFLLGYSAPDGELLEEPLFFSAVAGHDADFVSEDNPYLQAYGSVYDLLKEAVSTSGADIANFIPGRITALCWIAAAFIAPFSDGKNAWRISCSHVTYQPALTMDFGMILIVGAAFSGKSAYARRLLEPFMEEQGKDEPRGSLHADMEVSGDEPQGFLRADPEASGCDKVSGPDLLLTEVQELADCSMDEPDIKALADSLCRRAVVLTASETGAGIVPVDADMRRLRENQGRLLSELSERADCVVRVFYGIPEVIKGHISEALSGCRECAAESS